MIKFTIKFLAAAALFFIPAFVFQVFVINETSGDLGRLGMIPFGKENDGLDVSWYHRNIGPTANVVNIEDPAALSSFSTITIGDSFSQFGKNGYQYSLSDRLDSTVANFICYPSLNPLINYLILLNNGYFTEGQTVILESVERRLVKRFGRVGPLNSYRTLPKREQNAEKEQVTSGKQSQRPFLNLYFSWIRLSLGYRNPIRHFSLTKDCFTHERFSRTLHVYNSEKANDGDLMWERNSREAYEKTATNMKEILDYSEKKGINLIILVACDKYDAYEPWIKDVHLENPTLDNVPVNGRIFVTRECLRNAIDKGTKDVYKVNNTHWSVVGADIVGNSLYEWIETERLIHPRDTL